MIYVSVVNWYELFGKKVLNPAEDLLIDCHYTYFYWLTDK